MRAKDVVTALGALGDPEIAAHSRRFFKTAAGEYGAGDRFLGVRVPVVRRQARLYAHLGFVPFGPEVGTAEALYQPLYYRFEDHA